MVLTTRQMHELTRLVSRLFSVAEFADVLFQLAGPKIVAEMPVGFSTDLFIDEALEALQRRGLIDERFFNLLLERRPRSASAIRSFQRSVDARDEAPQYDFFISYAREDTAHAKELVTALQRTGARVWFDAYITPGQSFENMIRRAIEASGTVLVLLSKNSALSPWIRSEVAFALEANRKRTPIRVIPIFLAPPETLDVPYVLEDYKGLFPAIEGGMEGVAARLIALMESSRPTARGGFWRLLHPWRSWRNGTSAASVEEEAVSTDLQLRDLAHQFFTVAGREAVYQSPSELSVPEPALVAGDVPPSPSDVRGLARLLRPGQVGYFLYKERLPERTLLALDKLRVGGNPIVPLAANAMTAALADGTARAMLAQLDSNYRSRDNLFETRNALIDERFFFGRHDLLAQVGSALSRGEHILVFGLRKAGKTSLLNILRQHLPNHPFFISDLQKYDRHEEDWPVLLFGQLLQAYDQWGSARFSDWPSAAQSPRNATELEDMLRARREWQLARASNERLVVVLDEIERVFPSPSEEAPAWKFIRAAGALRSLGQSGADRFVSIIAADLRPEANRLNRLGNAGTNPFFNFFQEVPLPLLLREAVDEMITSIGRAMGVTIVDEDFLQRVFALAGGHPFVTRLLAGAAYRRRSGDRARLSLDDLWNGLDDLNERDALGSFFRENLWGELREGERRLLMDHVAGSVSAGAGDEAERAFLRALGLVADGKIPIELFASWVAVKAS
jgi:TIR domain-containing protein/conflict system STAND superfamily ATPase